MAIGGRRAGRGGLWRSALAALVAVLAVEAGWAAGLLPRLEAAVSDRWEVARGVEHTAHPPVVLVPVDDETLDRHPDPLVFWAPLFAQAIEALREHGATAIGLDYLLKVGAEDWFVRHGLADLPQSRAWDAPLRAQLFQGGVVLVGATVQVDAQGTRAYDLPLGEWGSMLGDPHRAVGLGDLPLDPDHAVRRFRPVVVPQEREAPALSFALALVIEHLGLDPHAEGWSIAGRTVRRTDRTVRMSWRGPPGSVEQVPLWKLLEPGALTEEDAARLRGRIAIIGAGEGGTADVFPTPHSRGGELMTGAEVQANAVATLLTGRRPTAVEGPGRVLLLLLTAWGAALGSFRAPIQQAVPLLGGVALAWGVGGYALFAGFDLLLPAASGVAAAGLAVVGAFAFRLGSEERERRFLRSVFERYVSDQVVAEILESPGALGLGGARRVVTVLFSDIRGFTTLSEKLDPEEVVELLNAWYARACAHILAEGGHVDKFAGDAVLGVFGAPLSREDHAARAVRAARAMASEVPGFQAWMAARFPGRDLPAFDIGVGLHTGPAVAGNLGFERRTEYTVIGDTVNVAARVEGLTRTLGVRILLTRAVLDAAGELPVGPAQRLAVKGRQGEVEMFELQERDATRGEVA